MIEFLIELMLEFFGEALLQIAFEALAQAGVHLTRHPDRLPREHSPWLVSLGYALLGLVAGGISLLVLPDLVVRNPAARIANLVLTPLLAGAAMAALGFLRRRRAGPDALAFGLERFGNGYLFALTMGAIRFLFAG